MKLKIKILDDNSIEIERGDALVAPPEQHVEETIKKPTVYCGSDKIDVQINDECGQYERSILTSITGDVTRADISICSRITGETEPYILYLLSGSIKCFRARQVWTINKLVELIDAHNTLIISNEAIRTKGANNRNQPTTEQIDRASKILSLKRRGDIEAVANSLGCNSGTIKHMFNRKRNLNTNLGKRILDAFEQIIATREAIKGGAL